MTTPNKTRARLDADRTAEPLTSIVHRPPRGGCIGPYMPLVNPEHVDADGKRTPLTTPAPAPEKTARGFSVYARIPDGGLGTLRVQRSSAATPCVWIFTDSTECEARADGYHRQEPPHLDVAAAKALISALHAFVAEAEAEKADLPAGWQLATPADEERAAWKALVNATMLRADCSCERDPLTATRKAQTDRAAALATLRRLGVDFVPSDPHGMWPKGDPK